MTPWTGGLGEMAVFDRDLAASTAASALVEKPFDCMFLIAVFVTPRDSKKAIDTLMREAAERTPFALHSGRRGGGGRRRSGLLWTPPGALLFRYGALGSKGTREGRDLGA